MTLGWLTDTGTLYARIFRKGAELALRNWSMGLAVVAYAAIMRLAIVVAMPFGLVGRIAALLVTVVCASSFLSLVEGVIRYGRVRLSDMASGFGTYLPDLLTLGFLLGLL